MQKRTVFSTLLAATLAFSTAHAQQKFEGVTGKAFDSAVPRDFYLEGNAIPTAKRNATLVKLPGGARALFSLIDTSGYSSEIQQKYAGMIITEGDVTLCGHKAGVGSYGFGWKRPASGADGPGTFTLYNQAGAKLTECSAARDAQIARPTPLQLLPQANGTAKLYYGRHWIEVK